MSEQLLETAEEQNQPNFEQKLSWRADQAKFFLLVAMTLAAPWLFGSTENWAVWTMNWCGYLAGFLFVLKQITRLLHPSAYISWRDLAPVTWLPRVVALLTGAILLYTFISALNARARFIPGEQRFEYYDHIPWLPFSYDVEATWSKFWMFLGLACYFWSLRDALLNDPRSPQTEWHPLDLPRRLRVFLWAISLNGAALALLGIFQRLSGTDKILWLKESWWHTPDSFFASFSYRGNASSYLNLIWPVTLGFWWTLSEKARKAGFEGRIGGGPHVVLLPCLIFTAATPMISTSRGGSIITFGALLAAAFILLFNRALAWQTRALVLVAITSVLLLGVTIGGDSLGPRLRELFTTPYANRNEIYDNAREMVKHYQVYGIGPGAASSLYQLYRSDPGQPWHAFLHDDWLETRVTFGWVGTCILLGMLALTLARWFIPAEGIPAPWELVALLWVSVGGCLVHAKASFPLQVYSILQLFLAMCCILLCVCRPEKGIAVEE